MHDKRFANSPSLLFVTMASEPDYDQSYYILTGIKQPPPSLEIVAFKPPPALKSQHFKTKPAAPSSPPPASKHTTSTVVVPVTLSLPAKPQKDGFLQKLGGVFRGLKRKKGKKGDKVVNIVAELGRPQRDDAKQCIEKKRVAELKRDKRARQKDESDRPANEETDAKIDQRQAQTSTQAGGSLPKDVKETPRIALVEYTVIAVGAEVSPPLPSPSDDTNPPSQPSPIPSPDPATVPLPTTPTAPGTPLQTPPRPFIAPLNPASPTTPISPLDTDNHTHQFLQRNVPTGLTASTKPPNFVEKEVWRYKEERIARRFDEADRHVSNAVDQALLEALEEARARKRSRGY